MKKRFVCILLVLLLTLSLLAFPVAAEDGQSTDTTTATTATQATQPPTQSTQPSTPATQPTTPSTQPSTPATQPTTPSTPPTTESTEPSTESTQPSTTPTVSPSTCTHTYGAWSTSETAHSRTCTKCPHTESSGHTWFSETITVAPTCKDAGGKAKVCTVCELILITEITPPLTTHTYTNACDTECNVCGVKREITHNYSAAWTKNGKGHWHACTVCGAAGEVKAHYPGPAATEEKEQICLTCGYVLMSKRGHVHDYSKEWSSDSTGHWHACDGCSELKDYAVHDFENGCDVDCGICGYTRTAVHTYGADWQRDEKTHSGVCTVCGEKGAVEDHVADAAGTNCSICGYAMEEDETEETHEHTYEEDTWGFDDTGHWQICSCGEKQQTGAHTWDDGREMDDNIITFTCKICGAQKQEQLKESGFPWLAVLIGIVMAAAAAGIVVCIILLRKQGKYSR